MKRKGSKIAYDIDIDYRHDQYMKRKAELKKLNKKTEVTKVEQNTIK